MQPKISVIIAAYNEEELIGKCLQSLQKQTLSSDKYEIIVIDNNSTDRTASIARAAGAKVISYTEKQGAAVAKQYGGFLAKSDIIAFTDSDSFPLKDWLENIYRCFQNEQLVCVGGTMLPLWGDARTKFFFAFFDYFAVINQWFGISILWGSNLAVRRDAFREVNGINTNLKTSDDWDLVMRLGKRFGRKSTRYTRELRVKTSPRKQEKLSELIPYLSVGIVNYFFVFILRKSKTFGIHKAVR